MCLYKKKFSTFQVEYLDKKKEKKIKKYSETWRQRKIFVEKVNYIILKIILKYFV
jgi:NADPH-dependent 7-cyano-7-deazaguanine reductase QueF